MTTDSTDMTTDRTGSTLTPSTFGRRALRARPVARAVAFGVGAVLLVSCTSGSGSTDTTSAPSVAVAPDTAATVPGAVTVPETTTTTGATTTTSSTSSTSTIPPTTIVHGAGPSFEVFDGGQVKPEVEATARSIYEAAITHNYPRLAEIIGDNRFRWGFVGERKPADAWKSQFDEGRGDELARIAALLDSKPGIDGRGNTVWPYLSLKDPTTYDAADEAELARLGFNPENILDTKAKGRYVDYRLIIDPTGRWTAFGVGY